MITARRPVLTVLRAARALVRGDDLPFYALGAHLRRHPHQSIADLGGALQICRTVRTENDMDPTSSGALADVASARGDRDREVRLLQKAQRIYARLGRPDVNRIHDRIESLPEGE